MSDEKLLAVALTTSADKDLKLVNDAPSGGNDPKLFNAKERLVIELADAMAETPANVSDELYARLRNEFSEEQLLELGAQIAFENFRARLNRVFDVPSDELYAPGKE